MLKHCTPPKIRLLRNLLDVKFSDSILITFHLDRKPRDFKAPRPYIIHPSKTFQGLFMGYPLLDLTNKTAVVIGGTSGIGLALIKALAQAGANVITTSRRSEQVSSAVGEGEAIGWRSRRKTWDVTAASRLTTGSGDV